MNSHKLIYKKWPQLVCKLCVLFTLALGLNNASVYAASNDTIHVGVDINNPPFEYLDDNGNIKGFTVELARELLHHIGKTPHFRPGSRDQIFEWLEKGEVDMLCNVANISVPPKNWEYGAINGASPLVLVVPKESSVTEETPIDSLSVLVEKYSYTSYALEDMDVHATIMPYENSAEILLRLLGGKGDAAYMSYHLFEATSKHLGNKGAFRVIDCGHPLMYYYYGIYEDQTELKHQIEMAMLDMIEHGMYATLHHQYFPNTVEAHVARLRYWTVIALVIVLLLFVSFFCYQYFILNKMKMKEDNWNSYMFSVFKHLPFSIALERADTTDKSSIDMLSRNTRHNELNTDNEIVLDNIHQDDYDAVVHARREALQEGQSALDFVRIVSDSNKGESCVDYYVCSMSHQEKEYLLTVGHDMRAVFQLHNQANEQVEERNRFLSNLSHELHTALNAVLGFSEIVSHSEERSQLREYTSIIRNKAKDFRLLVDEFILLSKIEVEGNRRTRRQNLALILQEEIKQNKLYKSEIDGISISFEEFYKEVYVCTDVNVFLLPLRVVIHHILREITSGDVVEGVVANEHHLLMYAEISNMETSYAEQKITLNHLYTLNTPDSNTGFGFALVKALALRLGGKVGVVLHEQNKQLFWVELPSEIDFTLIPEKEQELNRRMALLENRYHGHWYEKDVDGIILVHEPEKND